MLDLLDENTTRAVTLDQKLCQLFQGKEGAHKYKVSYCKEGGDNGLFQSSNFSFVGLTALGKFLDFDRLIRLLECLNISTTNFNLEKQ